MTLAGGVRLEARYEAFGRPASMVFHFRSPTGEDATLSDCINVAKAYGLWENDGALLGYFLLRGEDSNFTRANVFGLSGAPNAVFIDEPFSRSGFIPGLGFDLLPTSLAPVIRWATAERGLATGRTYAVGLTEAVNDTRSDKETVNGLYLDSLTTIFRELGAAVQSATGFVQCHLARTPRGGVGPAPTLLDITGVGVYELMGSQRRRTRPAP